MTYCILIPEYVLLACNCKKQQQTSQKKLFWYHFTCLVINHVTYSPKKICVWLNKHKIEKVLILWHKSLNLPIIYQGKKGTQWLIIQSYIFASLHTSPLSVIKVWLLKSWKSAWRTTVPIFIYKLIWIF